MQESTQYDAIVKKLAHRRMSKSAYRMHLLGMYASIMKSAVFNLCVLFVGVSLGMGFTVMHMQRVWREKYTYSSIHQLELILAKRGIVDAEVEQALLEVKDKCVEQSTGTKKAKR